MMTARIASLEAKLADSEEKVEGKTARERRNLLASIEKLEEKLGSKDKSLCLADINPYIADDVDVDDDIDVEIDDDDDSLIASFVDPNGAEEDIDQSYLTEVQRLEHGVELATGKSVLDVSPTRYVSQLKKAASRIDVVANYMEQTGRSNMALRLDRVSDAIDMRIAEFI